MIFSAVFSWRPNSCDKSQELSIIISAATGARFGPVFAAVSVCF